MKFRVCFTLAKYENDMLSLCETTNVFVDAFLLLQNPFPVTLQFDPHLVRDQFLLTQFRRLIAKDV